MRFAGIDIASEMHVVAVVDEKAQVVVKPAAFAQDASGYAKLFGLLAAPAEVLVAMEATGHYWKNLFAALAGHGYAVALINPLRTHRFAAQKRPVATRLPDSATEELRELVRLRDRLVQDFGDRLRQLHRLVDLGFPEFTRYVKRLDSELASAILHDYPTARAFLGISAKRLARLCYDGRHHVGTELAGELIEAAGRSVGQHHGEPYRIQVRYTCEDLDILRRGLRSLDQDIEGKLSEHEVGMLLTSIEGIGPHTAARLIAFRSAAALASYVGVVPGLRQSGKNRSTRAALAPIGHARLRAKLWMPTLTAVRLNPWLRAYYQALLARAKLPKVALVASMRKLLGAVYSVAKHRQPFIPRTLAAEIQ